MSAGLTGHLAGDTLKMKHGTFCGSFLRDEVPIKLNGIVHNGGKLADLQIDLFDLPCARIFKGNVQNTLSHREFMHSYIKLTPIGAISQMEKVICRQDFNLQYTMMIHKRFMTNFVAFETDSDTSGDSSSLKS